MLRCTIVILALTALACGRRAADQPAAGRSDTVPPAASQVADSALPLGPEDFVVAGLTSQTDDTTAVRARLRSPDSVTVYRNRVRGEEAAGTVTWHYRDLVVIFGGSITGLRFNLTGPGVATARGLRVGDAAERVLALYGEPYVRDEDAWTYVASDTGADVNAIHVQLRGRRVVSIAFVVWVD